MCVFVCVYMHIYKSVYIYTDMYVLWVCVNIYIPAYSCTQGHGDMCALVYFMHVFMHVYSYFFQKKRTLPIQGQISSYFFLVWPHVNC